MSNHEFTEYFNNHFEEDLRLFNEDLLCRKTIWGTFEDIQQGKVQYNNISYFFICLKFMDYINNSFQIFKNEEYSSLVPKIPSRDRCAQGCHIDEHFFTILGSAKKFAKQIGIKLNVNENSIENARLFFIGYLEQISTQNHELNIDSNQITKILNKDIVKDFLNSYN